MSDRVRSETGGARSAPDVVAVGARAPDRQGEQCGRVVQAVGRRRELPVDQRCHPIGVVHDVAVPGVTVGPHLAGDRERPGGFGAGPRLEPGRGGVQPTEPAGEIAEPASVELVVLLPRWLRPHVARHPREHLTPLTVDAQPARCAVEPDRLQMPEELLDGVGSDPARPSDRVADADDRTGQR